LVICVVEGPFLVSAAAGVLKYMAPRSTPEEAKGVLEKFPLGQAGLMGFDYIPLGPLRRLRIINDMVK
jgi:hypothetical protein